MAGVRGRSGRKAMLDSKTVENVLRLSMATVLHALRAPEEKFSYEKKVELARHLVVRSMPQNINFAGDQPLFQILMNSINKEGVQPNNRLIIAEKVSSVGEV